MTVPTEIADLVANSGNSFHARVAQWFKRDGWDISISPYYMDPSQNKAREIDLIAEKGWPYYDHGQVCGEVMIRLFIECKYIPSYSALWFIPRDKKTMRSLVCRSSAFKENNSNTDDHHYFAHSQVAKLFATRGTGQEQDPFYKALNQSLNAFIAMRGRAPLAPRRQTVTQTLEFPVIVCSSFEKLYAIDFFGNDEAKRIDSHFLMDVLYAYVDRADTNRNENFLLDFVEYDALGEFKLALDKDAEAAVKMSYR